MQVQPDKPEKVCAIVVTYHPQPSVVDNLRRLQPQVTETVVVDNGSGKNSERTLTELETIPGIHLIRNSKNLGIAEALNTGIRYAANANYNWVITFDQDSTVTPDFTTTMWTAYESCPFKERVALISPVHCSSEADWKQKSAQESYPVYSSIRTAMTSGSLIKTRALLGVGLYDEAMFIDYVDFDLCLRLWRRGDKLICSRRSFLLHHLGSPEDYSIFGFPFKIIAHSPIRRYYIMRNRVLMYRRYFRFFPLWVMKDFGWLLLEFTKILLIEQDTRAKFQHAIKGIRHGVAGITGQFVPNNI